MGRQDSTVSLHINACRIAAVGITVKYSLNTWHACVVRNVLLQLNAIMTLANHNQVLCLG